MEPLEALALLCRYYFHLTSMHFRNYPYLIKYYGWLSNARHELLGFPKFANAESSSQYYEDHHKICVCSMLVDAISLMLFSALLRKNQMACHFASIKKASHHDHRNTQEIDFYFKSCFSILSKTGLE